MQAYIDNKTSPLLNDSITHVMPFAFDEKIDFTSNVEEADFVPLLHLYGHEADAQHDYFIKKFKDNTPVVVLALFHDHEDNDKRRFQHSYVERYQNVTVLSTAYNTPFVGAIFYDMLFNRSKGLHGFGKIIPSRVRKSPWIRRFKKDIFFLEGIDKNIKYNILCPNRAYYGSMETIQRLEIRKRLHDLFVSKKWNNVLVSNPDTGVIFKTNHWESHYSSQLANGGVYAPIADKYYNESFVSVYVESVAMHQDNIVKSITEKTWEPMIKGNFILPYAAPGIIDELKRRGFLFPEFIDYSYCNYTNDQARYEGFVHEIQKIQRLTIEQVNTLYNDNVNIIQHNYNLFKTLPYDSLYDKLKCHVIL